MMETRIDRRQMKLDAKESMRGRNPSVYLVTLVYLVIGYVLGLLSTKLLYPGLNTQTLLNYAGMSDDQLYAAYTTLLQRQPGAFAQLLNVAIGIMDVMIGVGFISFCLNVSRGLEAGFSGLFDAFGNFFRLLWLEILIYIFTFLWSLLLIVPGIIAYYRYSMAVYIMLDDPDKTALECIRESKEMTRGHKWELFVLDLSFLGWAILSAIPFVSIYVLPYVGTTKANYYRALSGRWDAPEHIDVEI